jgi:F0F1-type ATP synthase membrane subunit b/b'
MESSREEIESRYEGLKKAHQELELELEQRNKELQAMVAERDGAGASQMQQQRAPRQHPTRQSF